MSDFLWVTKTDENLRYYADSAPKDGLAVRFTSKVDREVKSKVMRFMRYLRKEFYFPIRCNVYFCACDRFRSPHGGYSYGVFFPNNEGKRMTYPQIYVPAESDIYSIYYSLCHELTHYFQWFFYDDKEKSNRALEIQASRYARRVVTDFCSYCCKEPDSSCDRCRGEKK